MNNKSVLVAMSGGVDSSVSALLLKEQGFDVTGITFTTRYYTSRAVEDAQKVCSSLGVNLKVIDLTTDFENLVINYFINSYLEGKTPNPCVFCNPVIKWAKLLEAANSFGIEYFATGHYARIEQDSLTQRYKLKSVENSKDQSYFLWKLSQEQLARTIFPLADYNKTQIREKAAATGLTVAEKPDSQEICFIKDDYRDFLEEKAMEELKKIGKGDFVFEGKTAGKHNGFPYYTVGQRKGLGIALGKPVYVKKIDAEKNIVELGEKNELDDFSVSASNINYMALTEIKTGMEVYAKIRFNNPAERAEITGFDGDTVTLLFDKSKNAVAPGQSLVTYDADGYLLFGGEIE